MTYTGQMFVFFKLTMVSSMGYVVLSGKIQLDRQDTTLVTPISWAVCSTLSLILMLSLCEGGLRVSWQLCWIVDVLYGSIVSPESAGSPSCVDKVLRPLQLGGWHEWADTSRTQPWSAQHLCSWFFFNITFWLKLDVEQQNIHVWKRTLESQVASLNSCAHWASLDRRRGSVTLLSTSEVPLRKTGHSLHY